MKRIVRCHCFRPYTHFYFSLPKEKFLRGQGEKIPGQRRENIRVFVGNGSVIKKEYDLTIIVGKYR